MSQYLLTYIYGLKVGSSDSSITDEIINVQYIKDTNKLSNVPMLCEIAEKEVPLWLKENIQIEDKKARDIFMCGYFDSCGSMNLNHPESDISMSCHDISILEYIEPHFTTTNNILTKENKIINLEKNLIVIEGCNILEFLDIIYRNSKYHKILNMDCYTQLLNSNLSNHTKLFKFYKKLPNAYAPCKNRITDSGFDLYIVEKISQKKNVYMYDTGIIVQPTSGIYFDLVPRSSIIKTGYMLANSVGIIDQTFRGSIKVALIKIDPDAEELPLPLKIVQLIPRQVIQMEIEEIYSENELISTVRGYGEYGSTGN